MNAEMGANMVITQKHTTTDEIIFCLSYNSLFVNANKKNYINVIILIFIYIMFIILKIILNFLPFTNTILMPKNNRTKCLFLYRYYMEKEITLHIYECKIFSVHYQHQLSILLNSLIL